MISYRRLQPEQFEQWLDHCAQVFSKDESEFDNFRSYFKRHFLNDPWRDITTIFVALDEQKIVGTIRLFKRSVLLNQKGISMGGIGEVSVKPDYRKMGIASNLLRLVNEEMLKSQIKVSYLFGDQHIYAKDGYQTFPITYYKTNLVKQNLTQISLSKASDFDRSTIAEIYRIFNQNKAGMIVRNEYYWSNWVKEEVSDMYLLRDKQDQIVGFISAYLDDDTVCIKEYGQVGDIDLFDDATALFAEQVYPNATFLRYQKMFHTPSASIAKQDVDYLMLKVVQPVDDLIQTTQDLIEAFSKSDFGYLETDNF